MTTCKTWPWLFNTTLLMNSWWFYIDQVVLKRLKIPPTLCSHWEMTTAVAGCVGGDAGFWLTALRETRQTFNFGAKKLFCAFVSRLRGNLTIGKMYLPYLSLRKASWAISNTWQTSREHAGSVSTVSHSRPVFRSRDPPWPIRGQYWCEGPEPGGVMRSFIQRMGDEGERLRHLLRCSISVSRLNNYKLKKVQRGIIY